MNSPLEIFLRGKPKLALRQRAWRERLRRPTEPLKLHLGCGQKRFPGFVNIDHNLGPAVDYAADIADLPCPNNSVSRIETYHVIEHIEHPRIRPILKKWLNMLQPGGVFVAECPDFEKGCREFLEGNKDRIYNIFGLQRFRGDTHFFGYTEQSLCDLLLSVGFSKVVGMPPTDYHSTEEPCIRVEATK